MGATKRRREPRNSEPKRQPRSEITRRNILKAALREFAQLGLAGARVDKIAQRAGVNKQILYYHFGNKEGLFRATLASVYDHPFPREMLSPAKKIRSPRAEMRSLISGLFKHFRNIEDGTALIGHENRYHGKHLTPAVTRSIRASVSPIIEAIRAALTQGQREGVFAQGVSVERLYLTLVAMSMFYFTHAYTLSAILGSNLLDDDAVDAWRENVEKVILASIQTDRQ